MAGGLGASDNDCMGKPIHAGDPGGAITRVLSAEREARLSIENSVAEAGQLIADARSRARGILRTTQQRISRLHGVCKLATERRVLELENSAPDEDMTTLTDEASRALLRTAAADAARLMTTRDGADDAG